MERRRRTLGESIAAAAANLARGIRQRYENEQQPGGGWDYSGFTQIGSGIGNAVDAKRRQAEEEERRRKLGDAMFGKLNFAPGIGAPYPKPVSGGAFNQLLPYGIGYGPGSYTMPLDVTGQRQPNPNWLPTRVRR